MTFIAFDQWLMMTNFQGSANHDVFTAEVRLQTERYKPVCHIGEPARRPTCAFPFPYLIRRSVARDSGGKLSEFEEYKFTRSRDPVFPANVTSAPSLREPKQKRPVSHE
jgi:hypothetical protein